MKKKLKIVGSGSHCKVIIDCALSNGYKIEYIIDINSTKNDIKITEINGILIYFVIIDSLLKIDF